MWTAVATSLVPQKFSFFVVKRMQLLLCNIFASITSSYNGWLWCLWWCVDGWMWARCKRPDRGTATYMTKCHSMYTKQNTHHIRHLINSLMWLLHYTHMSLIKSLIISLKKVIGWGEMEKNGWQFWRILYTWPRFNIDNYMKVVANLCYPLNTLPEKIC